MHILSDIFNLLYFFSSFMLWPLGFNLLSQKKKELNCLKNCSSNKMHALLGICKCRYNITKSWHYLEMRVPFFFQSACPWLKFAKQQSPKSFSRKTFLYFLFLLHLLFLLTKILLSFLHQSLTWLFLLLFLILESSKISHGSLSMVMVTYWFLGILWHPIYWEIRKG